MAVLPDPFFDFFESGLGTRLGDHNITVMLLWKNSFVDVPLDGPYANPVHVSVCIYFHWLFTTLKTTCVMW